MKTIIKGHNIDVPDDLKVYIEEKINNVAGDLKEPSVCEVMLTDNNGHRGGEDREVRVTCTLPHVKNPVFVSVKSDNWFKSVDLIEAKLKRALHNAKR